MSHPTIKSLIIGQLCLYLAVAVQIWLDPNGLTANSGISYYSIVKATFVPYTIGFLLIGYFTYRATLFFPASFEFGVIGRLLRLSAYLLLGLTFSPDFAKTFFANVHVFFGTTLFLTELGLSFWLWWKVKRDLLSAVLVGLQTLSGIVCLLSLINVLTWQLEGQLVFQIVFATLLIRVVKGLLATAEGHPGNSRKSNTAELN